MGWSVKTEMLRAHRRTVELQQATTLEDSVHDGRSEVVIVQHAPPAVGMLVGREDHRAACLMALRDDVIEDVRGVVAVRQVADLVDDEHVW